MARLSLACAFVASLSAVPAHAGPIDRWDGHVAAASARCGVRVAWIERVMRAESGGQTMLGGRPIVSRAGAMGLMQLMSATWEEMRAALALGNDPHDPADNIVAGACYLRLMYDRFGYPGLFGAYNAGPGRYAAWLAGRSPLPGETRAYLAAVAGRAITPPGADAVSAPTPQPIFIALRSVSTAPNGAASGGEPVRTDALFLIRR